jgi:hypothetical protein
MKKIKKLLILALVVLAVGSLSVTALAAGEYGSAAANQNAAYTLTDMLTYAVQDEELAYAEYAKIVETYGNTRPFANIIKAEQSHIAALEKLFAAYGVALPANSAADYVTVPSSLTDALNAGIQAEKNNIAMYEKFLSQNLPDDVKSVFTALKNASEHHLAAFERSLSGTSGNSAQNGYGNSGYGMNGTSGCKGTGSYTGAGSGHMNQGQAKGNGGTGICTGVCVLQG